MARREFWYLAGPDGYVVRYDSDGWLQATRYGSSRDALESHCAAFDLIMAVLMGQAKP